MYSLLHNIVNRKRATFLSKVKKINLGSSEVTHFPKNHPATGDISFVVVSAKRDLTRGEGIRSVPVLLFNKCLVAVLIFEFSTECISIHNFTEKVIKIMNVASWIGAYAVHTVCNNGLHVIHAGTAVRGLVAFATRLWQKERGYDHNFLFVKQKCNF